MIIMVYLENIRREGNLMYCDYYKEVDYVNKENVKPFELIVNYATDEIVSTTEDHISGYTYHAKEKLLKLSKLNDLPLVAKETWY